MNDRLKERATILKYRVVDTGKLSRDRYVIWRKRLRAQRLVNQYSQSGDFESRLLAEKLLHDLDFRAEIINMALTEVVTNRDLGLTDLIFDLNPFQVVKRPAWMGWKPDPDFTLHRGDVFWNLHIPPEHPKLTFQAMVATLNTLAGLAQTAEHRPRCLLGITHPRIAMIAPRYGFSIYEQPLPVGIQAVLGEMMSRRLGSLAGFQTDKTLICYMPTEKLISKYA